MTDYPPNHPFILGDIIVVCLHDHNESTVDAHLLGVVVPPSRVVISLANLTGVVVNDDFTDWVLFRNSRGFGVAHVDSCQLAARAAHN